MTISVKCFAIRNKSFNFGVTNSTALPTDQRTRVELLLFGDTFQRHILEGCRPLNSNNNES